MGTTYPSPSAIITPFVSNSVVQVAPPNLQRVALYVFNPSPTVSLYILPLPLQVGGLLPSVGNGIIVQPQQYLWFGSPQYPPWTQGLNAIASSAGNNVIVVLEFYQ